MRLRLNIPRPPLFQDNNPSRVRIGLLAKPDYSAYRVFFVECDSAGCYAYANKRKLHARPATPERAETVAREAMQKHLDSGLWHTIPELRQREGRG